MVLMFPIMIICTVYKFACKILSPRMTSKFPRNFDIFVKPNTDAQISSRFEHPDIDFSIYNLYSNPFGI